MASATLTQSVHQRAPDVVIGVDTHKDIHVAVALAPNGGRLGDFRIPTTRRGYDAGLCRRGHRFFRSRAVP
jgi:transposase